MTFPKKKGRADARVQLMAYVVSCIDFDGYDDAPLPQTTEEAVARLWRTFLKEYGYNVRRVGCTQALADWLAGLPTCCTVAFANHEIVALLEQWGILRPDASESEVCRQLDRWFMRCAMALHKAARALFVDQDGAQFYHGGRVVADYTTRLQGTGLATDTLAYAQQAAALFAEQFPHYLTPTEQESR